MLDIMRKHASSWGIKVILTMIIVSFVLFFGYSKISSVNQPSVRGAKDQAAVAVVNHMAIPQSEYRYYYDLAYERLRNQFKDQEVPEFARTMAERAAMSQLVNRELMLQVADQIGLKVTDSELAEAIRASQAAMRGEFDPTFYTHQYLPYFENRFGINFEDMLRNDLRAEEVRILFQPVAYAGEQEKTKAPEKEKVRLWSFEVVTLDVDKMLEQKIVSSRDQAYGIARQFSDNPTNGWWKNTAKKYGADLKKVDSVALSERQSKLKGFTFDQYSTIFSLTEETPVVDNPISRDDNTIAVVRLLERKDVERELTPSRDDFFQQWMTKMAAESKIRTFLDDQNQARK